MFSTGEAFGILTYTSDACEVTTQGIITLAAQQAIHGNWTDCVRVQVQPLERAPVDQKRLGEHELDANIPGDRRAPLSRPVPAAPELY